MKADIFFAVIISFILILGGYFIYIMASSGIFREDMKCINGVVYHKLGNNDYWTKLGAQCFTDNEIKGK